MAYGFHHTRRLVKQLGGTVEALGTERVIPRSGRAYTVKLYRVSVPGQPSVVLDTLGVRMLGWRDGEGLVQSLRRQAGADPW